jgi:hypothetical protein
VGVVWIAAILLWVMTAARLTCEHARPSRTAVVGSGSGVRAGTGNSTRRIAKEPADWVPMNVNPGVMGIILIGTCWYVFGTIVMIPFCDWAAHSIIVAVLKLSIDRNLVM